MRPHPRIRKTIKWGGAAVTVLLVVVWIGSYWWTVGWADSTGNWFDVCRGLVRVGRAWGVPYQPLEPGWHVGAGGRRLQLRLDPMAVHDGAVDWYYVPLWLVAPAVFTVTFAAWRLDTLARRRTRLNLCPKCNYDRAGIAADAKCPECGAAPASV